MKSDRTWGDVREASRCMFKQSLFFVARSPVFAAFVSLLERFDSRQPNLLRVLTYHRIDEAGTRPHLDPATLSATPADFTRQMQYLVDRYHVVDFPTVLAAIRGELILPPRSVLITFDDASCDFAENSWPILRRFELPAMLFVPTAFPDSPGRAFWWDRLHAAICRTDADLEFLRKLGIRIAKGNRYETYRRVLLWIKAQPYAQACEVIDAICRECGSAPWTSPVLGWDQLRQLARQGLALGVHTRTHPLMNRLPVMEAVEEALGSYEDLRAQIGDTPAVLAFPGGEFSEAIVKRLRGSFELAFTTCRGLNDLNRCDRMRLRRINVGRNTPRSLVRAQLLTQARHLNVCWPLRGTKDD